MDASGLRAELAALQEFLATADFEFDILEEKEFVTGTKL
jgi:hypothetical protein